MKQRLVRIKEAAQMLGVCTETLRRWDKGGPLKPVFRSRGGVCYYSVSELEALTERKAS